MLGGLVTAVVMITLDTLFAVGEDRSYSLESTVDVGVGTYLLTTAVVLAAFGALRGGKPVDTPEPDSVTAQQE